jgi:2EXR family protein
MAATQRSRSVIPVELQLMVYEAMFEPRVVHIDWVIDTKESRSKMAELPDSTPDTTTTTTTAITKSPRPVALYVNSTSRKFALTKYKLAFASTPEAESRVYFNFDLDTLVLNRYEPLYGFVRPQPQFSHLELAQLQHIYLKAPDAALPEEPWGVLNGEYETPSKHEIMEALVWSDILPTILFSVGKVQGIKGLRDFIPRFVNQELIKHLPKLKTLRMEIPKDAGSDPSGISSLPLSRLDADILPSIARIRNDPLHHGHRSVSILDWQHAYGEKLLCPYFSYFAAWIWRVAGSQQLSSSQILRRNACGKSEAFIGNEFRVLQLDLECSREAPSE